MVPRLKRKSIHSYLYFFRSYGFTFFVYVSEGPVSKNLEIEELIKEMKEYRDGMVVRNLPFQWISDIITKWEMKQVMGGATPVTVSEKLQDELEPIRDTSNDPFKGTSIEGKD